MTAIVDYGVGNLFSLQSSLHSIGEESIITGDEAQLKAADRVILPGVGAFSDAAAKLRERGHDVLVRQLASDGKPLMGICLGMQLLFEKSFEYGKHDGLGLIKGNVRPIADAVSPELKIPHIGWNSLSFPDGKPKSKLFKYISEGDFVYFVHSFYAADCEESVIATTEYEAQLTAAVADGNVIGCQFHPEKSGEVGMNILRSFCEMNNAVV